MPDVTRANQVDVTLPAPPPAPVVTQRPTRPSEATRNTADVTKPERRRTTSRARSSASSSSSSQGRASSAPKASASRGAIIAYRSRVQSHLASRRPPGIGASGRVVINFGLTSSGNVSYASVANSSGNSALDRLALSTVRAAAPFPPPPSGSRPGDLRFAFPYTFR